MSQQVQNFLSLCLVLVISAKKIMFSVALVVCCSSVFLSVSNITQKFLNSLQWNYMERPGVAKKNKWLDFGSDLDHLADCPIGNPAITQWCEFLWDFQDKLSSDTRKQAIKFCWWSRPPCWLCNWKSGHYSTNYERIVMIFSGNCN